MILNVFVDFANSIADLVFDTSKEITDEINAVTTFFSKVIDLFGNMLDVFPTPFSSLIQVFLTLLAIIFIWKLLKAGG